MSTWNLGIGDVSEETHALRNKLSSKESQIAAQQDRLVRQAAEIQELNNALNETIHKLSSETERALHLEIDVKQRSEDLRNERIALQNLESALTAARGKVKDNGLETRDLQATLEAISHTSDEHRARGDRLEREKSMLDARVKELEGELQEVPQHLPTTTPNRRGISRRRSSSLSNFKITTLEQDLIEARTALATKDTELRTVHQKLSQMQNNLVTVDNEKLAMERKLKAEVGELQASLEEKEGELDYLKEQQGDTGREEDLLRRIDEDGAKIEALEMVLRAVEDSGQLEEKLQKVEDQVWRERKHVAELEDRQIELIREKEEALDELEEARCNIVDLEQRLRDRDIRDLSINDRAVKGLETCDDHLMAMNYLIDMETLAPQPLSSLPASMSLSVLEPDTNVVIYIERLFATIDRLRGERDSLSRDVEFLESESRFTIEALEAKLSASISSAGDKTATTISQLKTEMDELHSHLAEVSERNAATVESKTCEIKRLGLVVQTLAVALNHSSSQATISDTRLLLLAQDVRANQNDVMEKEKYLKDVEDRLNATILDHGAMTNQRDGLLAELQRKDSQWEKDLEVARTAEQETREELEDVLHRMSEIDTHLQNVESERDSLRLQITNLMTDMQDVQEELNNAEGRYTTLQFHQLSNMTNNEATRNLRGQIEELENRVMRRTEQIGIHQHDIKRLETNLRLQEERLAEMTTELEMMAAQKDAMVEDCADAREARDEALIRVERLEEELESSDGRNVDNAVIVESLIATIAQTVCQARAAIRLSREEVAEARGTHAQQSTTIQQLQEKETAFRKSIQEYQNEIQGLTTTLSQCQMEVKHVSALATNVQQENCELVSQLENGNLQVQEHETTINDLRRLNQELRSSLQEQQLSKPYADEAERKLVQLKLEHAEAIGVLQARLVKTSSDLEEVQTRYSSAQDAYQRTIQEANSSNLELEQQLGAATKKLAELEQLHEQYNDLKKEHAKQQSRLQEELTRTSHSYQDLERSRDALQDENVRLTGDLTRIQKEHAAQVDRYREENRAIERELEQQISSLQGQIEERGGLLDISERKITQIRDRLQEEAEGRAQDKKQYAMALLSEKERNEDADETISQLRGELETFERNLQQTNVHLQSVEDEKLTLQQQMTELEAEVQRSKSLSHYLEIQIRDSDQLVSTLKGDIERTKADLARSEKSWNTAEISLSLQNAQHKREMIELERELSAFRSMPNFEQALAELEERNNEMEELLRNKCVEIEENDDRALEMLKEKKKLTTKVESLTRKVQNLQAKLAAAKASSAAQPSPESQPTLPVPSLLLTSPTPQSTSVPISSRPRSATVSSAPPPIETPSTSTTRNPSNRVVSGPSFLPRPKTPERRTVTPVFKARTPERQMQPEIAPVLPAPVIGRKRAAPDDFGAYGNLPAQAFTADGEDIENRTPRERKVQNNWQSGFTPVRNQSSRPIAPSPRRGAPSRTSPFISDLTNSPHHLVQMNPSSAKPSKRSWLGKIRGNSQATDGPQAPMMPRSLFDRGDDKS